MSTDRTQRLQTFIDWTTAHITGDEKGQAQIFLDRLFQAFGQPGSLDIGGSPEFRIKKGKDEEGGTSFADYVWKPIVLIEMKKRALFKAVNLPATICEDACRMAGFLCETL
jgi:hypothetical protein